MRVSPSLRIAARLGMLGSFALAVLSTTVAFAQTDSVKPGINQPFQQPDVAGFVERFEKEGREVYDHRDRIVELCELKPGMTVADVGAGTGLFSRLLARKVGPAGEVIAVDIAADFLKHIERTSREAGITNIRGVVGSTTAVNLPAESVDLVFICDTYHHFEFPHKTMRSIHRALRPGGRVVLVEFHRIPGKSSDWVLGHLRAGQEVFAREIEEAGFKKIGEETGFLHESYFLRFEKVDDCVVSDAVVDSNGIRVHRVESAYQSGPTQIRVLLPEQLSPGKQYPVLYLLPVESAEGHRYGDGMAEAQRLNLADKFGLICVAPTFAQLPWYADHPTRRDLRQESYLLDVVVPAVEDHYPAAMREAGGRLLVGFSKSGWGAFSLLLRHPDVFGKAGAWDAPLTMTWPSKYGSAEIFATAENFEQYRILPLLERRAPLLAGNPRLVLSGYGSFHEPIVAVHEKMEGLHVPHVYLDGPERKHEWQSGWLEPAVAALLSP